MARHSDPMSLEDLALRRIEPEDLIDVKELHYAALRAAGSAAGPGPWDSDLDDVAGQYLNPGGEFLVAMSCGRIVGMGAFRPLLPDHDSNAALAPPGTAQLKRMRTLPELQGRGIGRTVLAALEAAAWSRGFRRVVLDTAVGSTAAVRLYTSAGYRQIAAAVIAGLPSLLFDKQLTQAPPRPSTAI